MSNNLLMTCNKHQLFDMLKKARKPAPLLGRTVFDSVFRPSNRTGGLLVTPSCSVSVRFNASLVGGRQLASDCGNAPDHVPCV